MSDVNLVIADTSVIFAGNLANALRMKKDINILAVCRSGAELIDIVAKQKPDAVLMDTVLEDIDGITALKRMRAAAADTVFIVCSEFSSDAAVSRAARNGASAFICKPADRIAIYETIVETVSVSRQYTAAIPENHSRIDAAISESLLNAGISSGCEGFRLLSHAIKYILDNKSDAVSMTKQLYPELARISGSTAARVERNIRTAIFHAHAKGMLKPFAKRPTNKELIFAVASGISEYLSAI